MADRLTRMEHVGLENSVRVYAVAEAILSGRRRADEAEGEAGGASSDAS